MTVPNRGGFLMKIGEELPFPLDKHYPLLYDKPRWDPAYEGKEAAKMVKIRVNMIRLIAVSFAVHFAAFVSGGRV